MWPGVCGALDSRTWSLCGAAECAAREPNLQSARLCGVARRASSRRLGSRGAAARLLSSTVCPAVTVCTNTGVRVCTNTGAPPLTGARASASRPRRSARARLAPAGEKRRTRYKAQRKAVRASLLGSLS